ncbi:MAG: hypothetical protein ACI9ZF_001830 [Bradyrhizobium sp.]|jgi:hypothetical protein
MRTITLAVLMLSLTGMPGLAGAQIYVCKDANGRTMTADRPIPECATRAMRELGSNGVLRREIPAPLTAVQREQHQRDSARLQAEADASLELRRRDTAILERFRSEAEIEAARKRAVLDVNGKIRQERGMLISAERQLKDALAEASLRTRNKVVPPRLAQQVEQAQSAVSAEQSLMQAHQRELLRTDVWFDDTLKRYRELTGSEPPR